MGCFRFLSIKVYVLPMNVLYILQNQHGYFLGKHKNNGATWLDGREPNQLFNALHKDEAVNMLFEVNSQDVDLRISIKEYEMNTKKHPVIPEDDLPPPLPKEVPVVKIEAEDLRCQA